MTLLTPCQEDTIIQDNKTIDFDKIRGLTEKEAKIVDQLIIDELSSDVVLINQIGKYIVNSGGKRLRPMLVLLASKALTNLNKQHLILAAVVEFIHTATLLHDDVVDDSDLRRGQDTVKTVWGNSASVLVGDFLLSKAFELIVRVDNMRVMDILSKTTTAIAEGEVLQLLNIHNPATTEGMYLEVISRKTAILFSAATQLGAIISVASEAIESAFRRYGLHLGMAFQLKDDVLDYKANPEETGKNIGDDLAEGKPTLPLIYAMHNSPEKQADVIRKAIETGDRDGFSTIYSIVESTDAIAYTEQCAQEEAQKAINALAIVPESEFKQAMIELARFSIQRSY